MQIKLFYLKIGILKDEMIYQQSFKVIQYAVKSDSIHSLHFYPWVHYGLVICSLLENVLKSKVGEKILSLDNERIKASLEKEIGLIQKFLK